MGYSLVTSSFFKLKTAPQLL